MADRIRGKTKFFDATKGWGFITMPDGKDIFVHHSEIEGKGSAQNPKRLDEGEPVEFELGQGKRGPAAFKVTRVSVAK